MIGFVDMYSWLPAWGLPTVSDDKLSFDCETHSLVPLIWKSARGNMNCAQQELCVYV